MSLPLLLLVSLGLRPISAQTDDACLLTQPLPQLETPTGIYQSLATQIAIADGLNPYAFKWVIAHESGWDPTNVSKTGDYGLVQIHLAAHPTITKAQAFDPVFSLYWMGEQWKQGGETEWTTYCEYEGLPASDCG